MGGGGWVIFCQESGIIQGKLFRPPFRQGPESLTALETLTM